MIDIKSAFAEVNALLKLAADSHLPTFFEQLAVFAKAWTGSDSTHVVLEDMVVRRFVRGSDLVQSLQTGDAATQWICERLEPLIVTDTQSETVTLALRGETPCAFLGVPIVTNGLGRGALYVCHTSPRAYEGELDALETLAATAALAISRCELVAKVDEHHRTMVRFALADPLTNLASPKHFDYMLRREWKRAQAEVSPLALLRLEVDAFEPHKGRIGPNQGRQTLRAVARLLDSALYRPSDLAARLEADRFAALLPDTDQAGAEAIAKRLVAETAALALPHPSLEGRNVTLSIGVAAHEPLNAEQLLATPDELTTLADAALEQAQTVGGNQVVSTR